MTKRSTVDRKFSHPKAICNENSIKNINNARNRKMALICLNKDQILILKNGIQNEFKLKNKKKLPN